MRIWSWGFVSLTKRRGGQSHHRGSGGAGDLDGWAQEGGELVLYSHFQPEGGEDVRECEKEGCKRMDKAEMRERGMKRESE